MAEAMNVWRSSDGLPSDSVTAIIQARDGFIWVGTDAGLVRFDGTKFVETKLAAAPAKHPIHITALCEDSNGYLWIGTQLDGLYELAGGIIQHFTKVDRLLDEGVTSLAADNSGRVWIASKSGLNLWDGEGFRTFTVRDGLPDQYVTSVNVARSGTVWITTRVGMCRFINDRIVPYVFQTESQGRSPEYLGAYEDRRGNLWAFGDTYLINLAKGKRFNYFRSSESASVRIWSLCEGRDGRLWIGTSGRGLFCFEENRFEPVIFDKDRWPFDVRAICEDNEGNLWLGTSGGGLIELRQQSVYILQAEKDLPGGPATALALDANGQVYIGLQRGGLFVGESGRFDRMENNDQLGVQNYVSSMCVTRDGTVWAGTLGSGLYGLHNGREIHFTTADRLADDTVPAVCSDANGGVWFSDGGGLLHYIGRNGMRYFDATDGLPDSPVTVIIPSLSGGLWVGTQDGQVLREEDGRFTRHNLTSNFEHNPILALYEGEPGQLWIGTAGGGLTCISNGVAMNWSSANGLPSDVVAGIIEDDTKNLWLTTGDGIYRVYRSDIGKSLENQRIPLACMMISEAKTIPDIPTITGGTRAALSPDGKLWFATSEGVLSVDTRDSEITPPSLRVYIENAIFNGQAPISLLRGPMWSGGGSTNLTFRAPVDLRSLEIHFTAPDYSASDGIRFRYKLDGSDPDWVDNAGNRSVRYNRLPYGHYCFHVAARREDGKWDEADQTFTFIVPTPIYYQTWALYLYGLTTLALITGFVQLVSHRRLRVRLARLEQQQSLERERMRIARDMHDEMGSKLTKISFLSEHAQMDVKAGKPLVEKIDSIAQTSRDLLKTMDEIVWAVNPRNDTLENLTAYLMHYAIEYFQNTPIECEMRMPQEVPNLPLSSEIRHNLFLAFEEALNNVLKHSGAKNVRVEMMAREWEFELKVIDDGRGFGVEAIAAMKAPLRGGSGGDGLKNMRQRLSAVGGECMISSHPGEGTTIIMKISFNTRRPTSS